MHICRRDMFIVQTYSFEILFIKNVYINNLRLKPSKLRMVNWEGRKTRNLMTGKVWHQNPQRFLLSRSFKEELPETILCHFFGFFCTFHGHK